MRRYVALLLCLVVSAAFAAEPLRVSGSTSVKRALERHQQALEAAAGTTVEFSAIGSTAGLTSLLCGTADVAMLSAPPAEVAAGLKGSVPATETLEAVQVGKTQLVFIVNSRNPVRHLTAGQMHDVLTGKVRNWQEVGGPDLPITLVALAHSGPPNVGKILCGEAIAMNVQSVNTTPEIPVLVAREPHTLGIVSSHHARGQTRVLQTDVDLEDPLYLVTLKPATPAAQKFVAAATELLTGD